MAEAHNMSGNDAFNAGDFARATELYFQAVEADGTVPKYRTNLANALLKCGKAALAVEEAAAAIAVDPSWPKGFYFKALALEELGDLTHAVAACEEGLRIHRHNAALEDILSRLQSKQRQQEQQQRQCQAARSSSSSTRTVTYSATVRDAAGHEQAFEFEEQVDSSRLARAAADQVEAARIIQDVTGPHYHEMLQAQPWLCVSCQLQHGRQQPATKLFLHAMSYLSRPQPSIQDMGPTPACASQACATYTTQMADKLKAELMAAMMGRG